LRPVKKLLKSIWIIILIILGAFIMLSALIFVLAIIKHQNKNVDNVSSKISIHYNSDAVNLEEPEPVYKDTMEEALAINDTYYFKNYNYMSKVNDVIKVFENDEYAVMFYHSIKDNKIDGFIASKFIKKKVNDKNQYALILMLPAEGGGKSISKPLKAVRDTVPFFDYFGNFGITEGNRFIFGSLKCEEVKKLKIEGQSPTEVIEYISNGKKEYFWYYDNLISDKPSTELNIEIEE
jgi:hypothetical protein